MNFDAILMVLVTFMNFFFDPEVGRGTPKDVEDHFINPIERSNLKTNLIILWISSEEKMIFERNSYENQEFRCDFDGFVNFFVRQFFFLQRGLSVAESNQCNPQQTSVLQAIPQFCTPPWW